MCFSCEPELVKHINPELARNPSVAAQVNYLRTFVQRAPLEIIGDALSRIRNPQTVCLILDSYDRFLAVMDDSNKRKHLEQLPPNGEEKDETFQEMIQCSRDLEKGLLQLFFQDDPLLAQLTREYGIF
jgi:hypothetical protein